MSKVARLKVWAAQQKRPMLVWVSITGYAVVWLDTYKAFTDNERIKKFFIRGLTRTKAMRDSLLWYAVFNREGIIIDEYQGRYYNG